MLGWSVSFMVLALVAGLFGLIGTAGAPQALSRLVFLGSSALFLISLFFLD